MTKMRALQTFARLGGRTRSGQVFETNEEHAAYLAANGLAAYVDGPPPPRAVGPSRRQPLPAPTEVNTEITAVGGGWYEWRGRRYRGRQAAEDAKKLEG